MKDLIINAFESALRQLNTLPELKKDLEKRPLSPPVKILAIGKSAFPMAKVCVDILNKREINYSGYLLTKYGNVSGIIPNLIVREASHPIPDINTIKYSREILTWLQELYANEELIILLSGGGSSLFEVPINGFTLEDLIAFNKNLLQSGLNIKEMNYERAKKSKVKAGKALNYIKAMKIYCYALSDVPDNEPDIIASGCFFPANSQKIEDNYYRAKLKKGKQKLYYSIIGDNLSLRYQLAKELPPPVYVHPRYFSENVENVAEFIADFAFSTDKKGMYIFGGEAPVKVTGNGIGGRCTHLALLLAKKIAGKKHITFYALASDGNDNLENVSGACVNQNTLNQLQAKGIDISSVIAECDSYSALKTINAVVPAFQNPLNLNDIYLLQLY
jgi:hydroxypyruvate reductase